MQPKSLMLALVWVLTLVHFSGAFAASDHFANGSCESFLHALPIPRTMQPTYLIELESAGDVVKRAEKIPPLKTGFYTFLIASTGEILLAPKYDVHQFINHHRGLATHKSLLRMYEEKTLTPIADQIVGSGEFQVAFGKVIDVNNRSGNFRGNSKRLRAAVSYLKDHGLPMDSLTRVHAIDPSRPEDLGHTPIDRNFDEYHLETMAYVEQSEKGRRLREAFEDFHKVIADSFPGLAGKEAIAEMIRLRNQGARQTRSERGSSFFYYPLLTAYTRDGIDFGIAALLRRVVISEFDPLGQEYSLAIPAQINNVLLGAIDLFPHELKVRWSTVAQSLTL